MMRLAGLLTAVLLSGCTHTPIESADAGLCSASDSFGFATPLSLNVHTQNLISLTKGIASSQIPIFSLLISKHGKIFYELYTSGIKRDQAHYLMSVSKSVTSALAGIAMDEKLLKGPNESVTEALPRSAFADDATFEKFSKLTLKDVMAMSALDAAASATDLRPENRARGKENLLSPDRLSFSLKQKLLPMPGLDFQYTDLTPTILAAALQSATQETLFDYAKAKLFDPMQFENEEWMHQDQKNLDNASFGLRLRPIDMQKFGLLYLRKGCWEGERLLSRAWVHRSFSAWMHSRSGNRNADYGWYWWRENYAPGWTAHEANGWQGQRITVFPEQDVVVTMTAAIKDGWEEKIFSEIIKRYVIPSLQPETLPNEVLAKSEAESQAELQSSLLQLNAVNLFAPNLETRLLPSVEPKGRHRSLPAGPPAP